MDSPLIVLENGAGFLIQLGSFGQSYRSTPQLLSTGKQPLTDVHAISQSEMTGAETPFSATRFARIVHLSVSLVLSLALGVCTPVGMQELFESAPLTTQLSLTGCVE